MALTDLTIIRRSIFSRLFSSVTTALTVAVAVALMLTLVSMRHAGRRAFERGSGNMHLLVSRDSSPLTAVLNGVFYANPPQRPLLWSDYLRITQQFPLQYAIPVQQGDSYRGFPTMATVPEFFTEFRPDPTEPWSLASGRFFNGEFEVVVGATAARETGLKAGDQIELTHGIGLSDSARAAFKEAGVEQEEPHVHSEFRFKVVGILNPSGSAHDRAVFLNLNSTWILHAQDRMEDEERNADHSHDGHDADHSHEHVATLADVTDADRKITGIYLRLPTREGMEAPANLPAVFDALRRDTSITVASPSKQIEGLFKIVSNVDQIFLAMALVVMLSSGIAIMLALYNSMEQRRRQIAVLRVLGASRGRVFGLVLTESAVLGLAGALAGTAIALVGNQVVAAVMKQRLGLVIQPEPLADTIMLLLLGTTLLASVAGLVPALMAYRTSVAQNLKPIG